MQRLLKYQEFINDGHGTDSTFWSNKGVQNRLRTIQAKVGEMEEASMNFPGLTNQKAPDQLFKVARQIGVSPEMICDHIGKEFVDARKLNKNKVNCKLIKGKMFFEFPKSRPFLRHLFL